MTDIALADQWDANSGAALPAYLADALGELGSNIPDRNTVPSLSYEGKTWQIVKGGDKTKLQARNSDGDMVPVPVMRVALLKFNADRGRAYYEGTYNPAASAAPKCWSPDGKEPDASVKEKQASQCNGCPMSVKGSKVVDGKEMVACSSHRMLAVAPAFDLDAEPLRLKIAVTSDYDKDVVEHGWYAFRQYVDWLKSRGVSHTALVVTKIKFDTNTAYPKLLFALDRPMNPVEVGQIKAQLAGSKVDELLNEKWTAAGAAGTEKSENDIKPHGLEGAYADGWIAHPDSAGWSYKGSDVVQNEELAARYPAPAPVEPAAPPVIPASEQIIEQKPAPVVPAAPPVPAATPAAEVHNPIQAAEADGWIKHPDAPDYHYKGAEVVLSTDVAAKYPAPAAAAPAAPPAVPAAPAAPAAPEPVKVDPIAAAEADGWVKHPDASDYHYKGADVKLTTEVAALYAGNGSTAAGSSASAGTDASSTAGQTATSGASPSSAEVPADVQALLDKWS